MRLALFPLFFRAEYGTESESTRTPPVSTFTWKPCTCTQSHLFTHPEEKQEYNQQFSQPRHTRIHAPPKILHTKEHIYVLQDTHTRTPYSYTHNTVHTQDAESSTPPTPREQDAHTGAPDPKPVSASSDSDSGRVELPTIPDSLPANSKAPHAHLASSNHDSVPSVRDKNASSPCFDFRVHSDKSPVSSGSPGSGHCQDATGCRSITEHKEQTQTCNNITDNEIQTAHVMDSDPYWPAGDAQDIYDHDSGKDCSWEYDDEQEEDHMEEISEMHDDTVQEDDHRMESEPEERSETDFKELSGSESKECSESESKERSESESKERSESESKERSESESKLYSESESKESSDLEFVERNKKISMAEELKCLKKALTVECHIDEAMAGTLTV